MKFDEDWVKFFSQELGKKYFQNLASTIQEQRNEGKRVFPAEGRIFEPFKLTPFADLKAVIVGFEPYSKDGFSDGLAFSVPDGAPLTPELTNIFKEMPDSFRKQKSGSLVDWAKNGILLLNSVLTVEEDKPKSHRNIGWEKFTSNCLKYISDNKDQRVVFCLWGKNAQSNASSINKKKHLVLKTSYPDDTFVNQGFSGCGHFIHLNQATRIWE